MSNEQSGALYGQLVKTSFGGLDFVCDDLISVDAAKEAPSLDDSSAMTVSTMCHSSNDKVNFTVGESLAFLRKLDGASDAKQVETLCPTILDIAEQHGCEEAISGKILEICGQILLSHLQSKLVRKFAISLMKICLTHRKLPDDIALWQEFFVLMVGLEEPQFHLVLPILPKMDHLLNALLNQSNEQDLLIHCFSMHWLLKILEKSLHHTNGWIRLWSLQKFVAVPSKLIVDQSKFLFDHILPALNSYDTLWRLIERKELDEFFQQLGKCMAQMTNHLDTTNRKTFYKHIFKLFCVRWNPCALFFISHSLVLLEGSPLLTEDDFSIVRPAFVQLDQIQYAPLRIVTVANFFQMLFRLTRWNENTVWQVPSLFKILPNSGCARKSILQKLAEQLSELSHILNSTVILNHYLDFESTAMTEVESSLQSFKIDVELGIFAPFAWLLAEKCGIETELLAELESSIVEMLEYEVPDHKKVDLLLVLWMHQPLNNGSGVESFSEIVQTYTLTRLFSLAGATTGYIRFITKTVGPQMLPRRILNWLNAFFPFSNKPQKPPLCQMHSKDACLVQLLNAYHCVPNNTWIYHTFQALPRIRHIPYQEYLKIQQLEFLLHYTAIGGGLKQIWSTGEEIMRILLDWLIQVTEFHSRNIILKLFNIMLAETQNLSFRLLTCIVQRLQMVLDQERRTKNYLQAVEIVLEVLMQETILKSSDKEVVEHISSLFDAFMEESTANLPMAVVFSEALLKSRRHLEVDRWTDYLIKLAIFGPIQKKDAQTLSAAYQMTYSDNCKFLKLADAMSTKKIFLIHQAAHITRLNAISCIISLISHKPSTAKSPQSFEAANHFVEKIIEESSVIDDFKTRSYGLSLAHRQKTRLMQLLLLVVDYIDQTIAEKLFKYCVQAILDTSQQFSVKLLVEWTTLRICNKYLDLFDKFVGLESELASKRIGSISSWINVLQHHYRSLPENEICLQKAFGQLLPWCTAQNFAVRCTAIAAARLLCRHFLANNDFKEMAFIQKMVNFNMETTGNGNKIINNSAQTSISDISIKLNTSTCRPFWPSSQPKPACQ
uniref:Uncharacterized protein n=1 Tax=Ditylenchus dipsaci TaxID=166011 RepID=A0A915DSX8_9BILA